MTELIYSSEFCDKLRGSAEKKIEKFQTALKEIQLLEDLHHFGDLGVFDRSFVENEFASWLNSDEPMYVEERLKNLPFEKAYCYKNPEFHTKSRRDILQHIFGEENEWRDNPSLIHLMSIEDKYRIIKRFEYMCYYIINTYDELLFDLNDMLL